MGGSSRPQQIGNKNTAHNGRLFARDGIFRGIVMQMPKWEAILSAWATDGRIRILRRFSRGAIRLRLKNRSDLTIRFWFVIRAVWLRLGADDGWRLLAV
jgi:hypothetical protein